MMEDMMGLGSNLLGHGQAFGFFYVLGFLVAYAIEFGDGRRRGYPLLPWTALLAFASVAAVAGSQLGTIPLQAWREALAGGAIPTTAAKSYVFGLPALLIAILLVERWLGFRRTTLDSLAFALPAGLAVGRIGCLLGGCCHGTPSSLPWAITYPAGTRAFDVHLSRGLILPGATNSLAVHPVQLYEILLLAVVIAVLALARRRLNRVGSLFLLYVALQSLVRFAIEFVREEPVSPVLGLRPLQWVLLLAAAAAGACVYLRERPQERQAAVPGHSLFRSATVVTSLVVFLLVFRAWFTPLERCVVAIIVLPAALMVGLDVTRRSARGNSRWASAAVFALMLALLGAAPDSSDEPRHISYYTVGGAGSLRKSVVTERVLEEDCDGNQTYHTYRRTYYDDEGKGLSLSRGDRWRGGWGSEVELRGFHRNIMPVPRESADWRWGGSLVLTGDSRWAALGLGFQALAEGDAAPARVLPAGRFRLGNSNLGFFEGGLNDALPDRPSSYIGVGFAIGRAFRCGVGTSDAGFYVNPAVYVDGFSLSPLLAFGPDDALKASLALKFGFGLSPLRLVRLTSPFPEDTGH
jgi:prolipoprotein diacylglyceryltransferase